MKNENIILFPRGAVFDIDEMLVLHQHQCINQFVSSYSAPAIMVNWAFFLPEYPLKPHGISG